MIYSILKHEINEFLMVCILSLCGIFAASTDDNFFFDKIIPHKKKTQQKNGR